MCLKLLRILSILGPGARALKLWGKLAATSLQASLYAGEGLYLGPLSKGYLIETRPSQHKTLPE